MERVNVSNIELNDDYSYSYRGVPFTGIAYECGASDTVVSEMTFINGIKDGESIDWYPSGAKRIKNTYLHNTLHGVCMEWFEDGKQKKRAVYELGILIEADKWDADGNAISQYRLTEADRNFKTLQKLRLSKWQE